MSGRKSSLALVVRVVWGEVEINFYGGNWWGNYHDNCPGMKSREKSTTTPCVCHILIYLLASLAMKCLQKADGHQHITKVKKELRLVLAYHEILPVVDCGLLGFFSG